MNSCAKDLIDLRIHQGHTPQPSAPVISVATTSYVDIIDLTKDEDVTGSVLVDNTQGEGDIAGIIDLTGEGEDAEIINLII